MDPMTDQQARTFVQHWLDAHPDRLRNRRQDPEQLRHWQDTAVQRLRTGLADDAEFILRRFATKTETHSMD
ncbi:hypothetical protein LJ737_18965 [Hymenobacter sp. 15J16-1T3B]|uniref:hypothetical protein n=1 Tax=Hymenobacter sp. 15J16-1T3B TaxID=2886941 RepID=UPI001D122A8B|nr:hypothetical protein [Hymenobacter sp. 15J16-1T3B]MCC3159331.1 hypothetical protein [Hymenobacter sp. 15J16-1T3B]